MAVTALAPNLRRKVRIERSLNHTPGDPWQRPPLRDSPRDHLTRDLGGNVELTFASFRHGGFTEAGDAELTDREIMAQGRHKSAKVLNHYVKKTERQVAAGITKRRATRTDGGHLSE
jgi:hypothetical protein